jgi:glycosyltransferase involved in cell wall biosynthesis
VGSDIVPETLDYKKDFDIHLLNPEYDFRAMDNDKVSYFTSLFNTPQVFIEKTVRTLLNQTNPSWEWVLVDDSNNSYDAERLSKYFDSLNDQRIKYFRYNKQSGGIIGNAKKRVVSHCTGKYLAELDHDDLLMPDLTELILSRGTGYDFIYTNSAEVMVTEKADLINMPAYPEGFAMGYGKYRTTVAINPLTGTLHSYEETIVPPINPKTIRNIVGIPNHIRVWNRDFYHSISGHNPDLMIADDYELVLRSFLAGGKFLHIDTLGYLQVNTGANTTDIYRQAIYPIVTAIVAKYDEDIKNEFKKRKQDDWAYDYHKRHYGFGRLRYHDVYSVKEHK